MPVLKSTQLSNYENSNSGIVVKIQPKPAYADDQGSVTTSIEIYETHGSNKFDFASMIMTVDEIGGQGTVNIAPKSIEHVFPNSPPYATTMTSSSTPIDGDISFDMVLKMTTNAPQPGDCSQYVYIKDSSGLVVYGVKLNYDTGYIMLVSPYGADLTNYLQAADGMSEYRVAVASELGKVSVWVFKDGALIINNSLYHIFDYTKEQYTIHFETKRTGNANITSSMFQLYNNGMFSSGSMYDYAEYTLVKEADSDSIDTNIGKTSTTHTMEGLRSYNSGLYRYYIKDYYLGGYTKSDAFEIDVKAPVTDDVYAMSLAVQGCTSNGYVNSTKTDTKACAQSYDVTLPSATPAAFSYNHITQGIQAATASEHSTYSQSTVYKKSNSPSPIEYTVQILTPADYGSGTSVVSLSAEPIATVDGYPI